MAVLFDPWNGSLFSPIYGLNSDTETPDECTILMDSERETETPDERTILVLGKVGVGKATLANHIMEKKVFPVKGPVESVTRLPSQQRFHELKSVRKYTTIKVYIIDTIAQSEKKNRYEAIKLTEKVNLILFVIQRGSPWLTKGERDQLHEFMKQNGQLSKISALIITFCEVLDQAAREEVVADFRRDKYVEEIAKFMEKGIFTVGFPNPTAMDETTYQLLLENIREDEKKLYELIDTCNQSYSVNEGNSYKCTLI